MGEEGAIKIGMVGVCSVLVHLIAVSILICEAMMSDRRQSSPSS